MMDIDKMKKLFNIKLIEIVGTKSDNNCYMSKAKYDEKLSIIKELKNKHTGKTPKDYQRLKRYDIIKIGEKDKLIYPTPVCDDNAIIFKHYVCNEEIFDILHEAHLSIGHGGRNRMKKELERNYKNITVEAIMIYLNLCEFCQKKMKVSSKPPQPKEKKEKPVINAIINTDEIHRCQIDLIDMQNQEDKGFRFILVYQDILTKFLQLRPIKHKQPEDIAYVLLDIFTIFGAPCILQSNHGREFSSQIVEQINLIWKDCKMIHGAPRHNDKQSLLPDITNMLNVWLKTNKTVNWSEGLRFVQLSKNRTYHEAIKASPYEAIFGSPVKLGLRNSNLPNEIILHVHTEEELEQKIMENLNCKETNVIIKKETEDFSENKEMWNVTDCATLCKVTMYS